MESKYKLFETVYLIHDNKPTTATILGIIYSDYSITIKGELLIKVGYNYLVSGEKLVSEHELFESKVKLINWINEQL